MISPKPKVSIGIPVYNGENFLAEALSAAVEQTFSDIEIIVCDNGSSDGSQQICQDFADRDSRIQYHRSEKNLGLSKNYNRAFELGRGEYFKWLAHDDYIAPQFVERCVQLLDANPEVVLACPKAIFFKGELSNVFKELPDNALTDLDTPHERLEALLLDTNRHYVNGLIRSSILRRTPLIGPFTDADGNLLIELSLFGPFGYVPELLLFLREHEGRSIHAHHHYSAREEYFDPEKSNKLNFPAWRALAEYHKSIHRSPISFAERMKCYKTVAAWTAKHRLRVLGGQVKYNLMASIKPHHSAAE